MFIMFDLKDKLHSYCNFGHNLFKTCVSASLIFLVRFDTIRRFFYFGVKCRGINATLYGTRDPVWVGDGVVWWWVMGGVRVRKVARGGFVPRPLRPPGT